MKLKNVLEKCVWVLLIIFGLFLFYQIMRAILGGSWTSDQLAIALLVFNTGAVLSIILFFMPMYSSITKARSDLNHLTRQFSAMSSDFKAHLRELKKE